MKTFETLLPKISAMDVFKFWLLGEMAVYETFKESQEEGNVINKKMFCVLIFPLFSIKTFINETCILFPIVWRKMDSLYQNFAQGVCRRPHSFSEFSDWENTIKLSEGVSVGGESHLPTKLIISFHIPSIQSCSWNISVRGGKISCRDFRDLKTPRKRRLIKVSLWVGVKGKVIH